MRVFAVPVFAAIYIVASAEPARAGTTTTFYGTSYAETIVVGQRATGGCASGYQYVACVGSSWSYGSCYEGSGDLVTVLARGNNDHIYVFRWNDQDYYCGGWLHIYPMDRSTCPTLELYGEDGDDEIFGSACAEELYGGDDDDTVYGYGGSDLLSGGYGDDVLWGGDGADIIAGDEGSGDEMYGEGDEDCLVDDDYDVCDCGPGTDAHECYDDENSPISCYWEGCLGR